MKLKEHIKLCQTFSFRLAFFILQKLQLAYKPVEVNLLYDGSFNIVSVDASFHHMLFEKKLDFEVTFFCEDKR